LSHNVLDQYSSSPSRGDIYERDLEANYCKNFSCCGLTLGDLHALLQHYEEAHVRFEEDDDDDDLLIAGGFTDDDGWSTHSESAPSSPQMGSSKHIHSVFSSVSAAAALTAASGKNASLSLMDSKKKPNSVSLSDIYSKDSAFFSDEAAVSAFPDSILRTSVHGNQANNNSGKKRDLSAFSSSLDLHSPISKKPSMHAKMMFSTTSTVAAALTAATLMGDLPSSIRTGSTETSSISAAAIPGTQDELMSSVTGYLEQAIQRGLLPNCGEVGSPAYLHAVDELLRKRDEIISMMESIGRPGLSGADKPYRCTVHGCDKAYKNPNGLKYHNQHGHCSMPGANDDDKNNSKPYRCTFLDCGKCYKNLNGLKYHIEHSHPNLAAALYANLPGFVNLEGSNASQAAITAAAAIAAVKGDSVMMNAINAIIASAINNGTRPSSTTNEQTPDSSPNSSPVLRPVSLTKLNASNITPMTSPLPPVLSVQTTINGKDSHTKLTGLMTPISLSPTSAASPKSPATNGSQVSTLTAALAAVAVERQCAVRQ
ncbi:hypothetical protein BGZ65_008203, partial [Modicella reniformis]